MERSPWHPKLRYAFVSRPLVLAVVTAIALAVLAAGGLAATNGTERSTAPGPNGCPTDKSLKTAPIADLAPPARLQIAAFDVLSGPINEQTATFTLKVRVGSTCSVNIKGASVYVTAVPYNQFRSQRRNSPETKALRPWSSAATRTSPQAASSSNSRSSSARRSQVRTPSPAFRLGGW